MKLLTALSVLVLTTAPAHAGTIRLTCKETEIQTNYHHITTAGRFSSAERDNKLWTMNWVINPDEGYAMQGSWRYKVSTSPTEYRLVYSENEKEERTSYSGRSSRTFSSLYTINRGTLRFSHSSYSLRFEDLLHGLGQQEGKSERKSTGICTKMAEPANNQI